MSDEAMEVEQFVAPLNKEQGDFLTLHLRDATMEEVQRLSAVVGDPPSLLPIALGDFDSRNIQLDTLLPLAEEYSRHCLDNAFAMFVEHDMREVYITLLHFGYSIPTASLLVCLLLLNRVAPNLLQGLDALVAQQDSEVHRAIANVIANQMASCSDPLAWTVKDALLCLCSAYLRGNPVDHVRWTEEHQRIEGLDSSMNYESYREDFLQRLNLASLNDLPIEQVLCAMNMPWQDSNWMRHGIESAAGRQRVDKSIEKLAALCELAIPFAEFELQWKTENPPDVAGSWNDKPPVVVDVKDDDGGDELFKELRSFKTLPLTEHANLRAYRWLKNQARKDSRAANLVLECVDARINVCLLHIAQHRPGNFGPHGSATPGVRNLGVDVKFLASPIDVPFDIPRTHEFDMERLLFRPMYSLSLPDFAVLDCGLPTLRCRPKIDSMRPGQHFKPHKFLALPWSVYVGLVSADERVSLFGNWLRSLSQ